MIENDLDKVLNYMKRYVENVYEHDSEIMLNWKDIKLVLEEIERLNNIIEKLEYLIKEDIICKLCEIENKRIGYGQTEIDKIWLKNLWGLKKHIVNKCNEILDKGKE